MAPTVRDLLETVECRLGETIEAFTVLRSINESCNAQVNPAMNKAINKRAGFWTPVTVGLQTTVITGIISILDKGSESSATLYLVLNKLGVKLPPSFPPNFENDLDVIRDRYKKFRHKLFGHNDIRREAIANEFDQPGFTWESIAVDLDHLEHAFKVLWHVDGGDPIPDAASTKQMQYPYNMSVSRTKEHTSAFISSLVI